MVSAAALLLALATACGTSDLPPGVNPGEADYVLTVFELPNPSEDPCPALQGLPSKQIDEGGWKVCFPKHTDLFSMLDCLGVDEGVLHEGTGRIFGWNEGGIGWGLFLKRSRLGGEEVVISGHGGGELGNGRRGMERVIRVDCEVQHQSGSYSMDGLLKYEGTLPKQKLIMFHRPVGEPSSAPLLCVALEIN